MRKIFASTALVLGLAISQVANAGTISLSASVGGAATGSNKLNFDSLTLGSAGTQDLGLVTLVFGANAKVVQGSVNGVYAAPFVSGSNGTGFGNLANAVDSTRYLSTGTSSITFDFEGVQQKYFGLLWGSVDAYNWVKFYKGGVLVDTFNGTNVTAGANGNQGVNGTFYVNFTDAVGSFDKVVLSSTSYAFELDNVAFNTRDRVPDAASTLGLLGLAIAGLAALRRRK